MEGVRLRGSRRSSRVQLKDGVMVLSSQRASVVHDYHRRAARDDDPSGWVGEEETYLYLGLTVPTVGNGVLGEWLALLVRLAKAALLCSRLYVCTVVCLCF